MSQNPESRDVKPPIPELESWVKPWMVVKINAFFLDAADYNNQWGVITRVRRLDEPTHLFTIENIGETIFYPDLEREPYRNVLEVLDPDARERVSQMLVPPTPEQALEEAAVVEPALAELEVAVYDEDENYRKIKIYDVEVKIPIGSLDENLTGLTDEEFQEEVVPFIKEVMDREAAGESNH